MTPPRRYASFEIFRREELHEEAGFSFTDLVRDEECARGRAHEILFDDQVDEIDGREPEGEP